MLLFRRICSAARFFLDSMWPRSRPNKDAIFLLFQYRIHWKYAPPKWPNCVNISYISLHFRHLFRLFCCDAPSVFNASCVFIVEKTTWCLFLMCWALNFLSICDAVVFTLQRRCRFQMVAPKALFDLDIERSIVYSMCSADAWSYLQRNCLRRSCAPNCSSIVGA